MDGESGDPPVLLGEIAHIVAESPEGPRGTDPISGDRNGYENLILLCNSHHQLVDAQPHAYTVERLLAMRDAHEDWVRDRLGGEESDETYLHQRVPLVEAALHATLLAVEHMPRYVYGARAHVLDPARIRTEMHAPRDGSMAPFIVRGDRVYTFQTPDGRHSPFRRLVEPGSTDRELASDWWDDPDRYRWFVELLGRATNKLTGRRGLRLDKEHHRYYFPAEESGATRSVTYRPLNQKRSTRKVAWQPQRQATGEARDYWLHLAVSLRYLQVSTTTWCLSVRPGLRVTTDGIESPPTKSIARRVNRRMARMFNYDLLGEVNFWRDFLSDSSPRILMKFGEQGQYVAISSRLLDGSIQWPGIPPEFAKPFSNVEYAEDLFSWGELNALADNEVLAG